MPFCVHGYKDDEIILKVKFTSDRAADYIFFGFIDTSPAAGYWGNLTLTGVLGKKDAEFDPEKDFMIEELTGGIEAGKVYEKEIKFTAIANATNPTKGANTLAIFIDAPQKRTYTNVAAAQTVDFITLNFNPDFTVDIEKEDDGNGNGNGNGEEVELIEVDVFDSELEYAEGFGPWDTELWAAFSTAKYMIIATKDSENAGEWGGFGGIQLLIGSDAAGWSPPVTVETNGWTPIGSEPGEIIYMVFDLSAFPAYQTSVDGNNYVELQIWWGEDEFGDYIIYFTSDDFEKPEDAVDATDDGSVYVTKSLDLTVIN